MTSFVTSLWHLVSMQNLIGLNFASSNRVPILSSSVIKMQDHDKIRFVVVILLEQKLRTMALFVGFHCGIDSLCAVQVQCARVLIQDYPVPGAVQRLWSHLSDIINIYFDLDELGYSVSLQQLAKLSLEPIGGFISVEPLGIPCKDLRGILEEGETPMEGAAGGFPTKKQCLINALKTNVDWAEGKQKQQSDWPMVLVLVRRREYAMSLEEWLLECEEVRQMGLRVRASHETLGVILEVLGLFTSRFCMWLRSQWTLGNAGNRTGIWQIALSDARGRTQ